MLRELETTLYRGMVCEITKVVADGGRTARGFGIRYWLGRQDVADAAIVGLNEIDRRRD